MANDASAATITSQTTQRITHCLRLCTRSANGIVNKPTPTNHPAP